MSAISAPAQVAEDYQLKAIFLWRLAQFTDWPANAFERASSPIVIGVLGTNPFGDALDIAVRGETAHGRKLVVEYYRRVTDIKTCHILYITEPNERRAAQIIADLAGRSLLTASDTEGFARSHGGMVRFITEQNRIKLRINLKAVINAGLRLDARVLRAAEIVGNE